MPNMEGRTWTCSGCSETFDLDDLRGGKCRECRMDELREGGHA